ncbi:phosphate starvation-inducible protein PhoH [Nibricoccus aquaticus]|uniref:Phosphate starvation-inducible protein PhoH n=1 Tax=Nibricoccus aquaticus TaxID=2576891 RepID=A0A290Q3N6_9BACT|nr:PhoH family protein [Nibricoccus aquaticus]ATC63043.1 phosphate starvation-inducible protein PhoH [Nibricoccus aquaticus]
MEILSRVTDPKTQLKVSAKVKTFVLDTNVLLHDPQSIFKFEDNNLAIPVEVLEELDAIKTEQSTERGRNARRVHRILQELLPDSRTMLEGVKLPNGGTLSVIINRYLVDQKFDSPAMQRFRAVLPDFSKKDNRIIACALFVQEQYDPPTILVTKDVNVQLKARAVGLESEDYLNDKVPEAVEETSYREIPVTIYELQRFCSEGEFDLGPDVGKDLFLNEYILLRSNEGKTMPARFYGNGSVRRLKIPDFVKAPGGIPIRPRNLEQQFFMDALLDESLSMVTCFGKAGTGKTLISIACALHQTHDDHSHYDGLSISRPVIALGKDIGFLPGTLEEKMKPWLQPYFDALEVMLPSKPQKEPQFAAKKVSKKHKKKQYEDAALQAAPAPAVHSNHHHGNGNGGQPIKPYEKLIKSGLVEIEALAFIRGRSIARRFFILDEAQQLTPHEVKTIITRISEGSKIVLIGDPAQIDNPYVDSRSNGLVYCYNRMKGQSLAAHITLMKGERSKLAELAADLL